MTRTMGCNSRPAAGRRGVTLVEMLVTVAVLVIIMTIMVQIFQSATGALSAAQSLQELDNQLKLLDSTIRSDLGGVTARFTPPLDPAQNLGYFEYIENEFADLQGEDSDDCLRFTAKAPPGQPFTGRLWVTPPSNAPGFYNATVQPITVTSEYAEIIYFLRNGNLYRRVLLIAPELQSSIVASVNNVGFIANGTATPTQIFLAPGALGGVSVSWQGVNDLSAHPAATGPNSNLNASAAAYAAQTVVLNTLGSLTNRENRFAAPRFSDDYFNLLAGNNTPDGFSDDLNADKVPDLYPTLYPNVLNTGLINAPGYLNFYAANTPPFSLGLLAFPYLYPGAYSFPQVLSKNQYGWIHSPTPVVNDQNGNTYQFDTSALVYLNNLNHNPLDVGDNGSIPDKNTTPTGFWSPPQTWWGFPTWRETLSVNWIDPTRQVNDNVDFPSFGQPNGLTPRPAGRVPVIDDGQILPWMGNPLTVANGGSLPSNYDFSVIRRSPQLFSDAAGYRTMSVFLGTGGNVNPVWAVSWEDDLVMTNVRSFDVKAYDNAFAGYADLGWGDDLRLYVPYQNEQGYNPQGFPQGVPPYLAGTPNVNGFPLPTIWPPLLAGTGYNTLGQTLAHEGRMPPITTDLVVDAQYGNALSYLPANSPFLVANGGTYNGGNVGDDAPGVGRLRRVWDSWSTAYSQAPGHGLNNATGFQDGPPLSPPIYPSYPPPYPAPLRGIQIQIRVADPTNHRTKSLTIRQDFTDKL